MHVKKGDTVIVISGKDRGVKGKILQAFPRDMKVLVEGVNMKKKHQRARRGGQKGQIVSTAHPLDVSNVMILDPKKDTRTRIGKKLVGERFVRITKKSGSEL